MLVQTLSVLPVLQWATCCCITLVDSSTPTLYVSATQLSKPFQKVPSTSPLYCSRHPQVLRGAQQRRHSKRAQGMLPARLCLPASRRWYRWQVCGGQTPLSGPNSTSVSSRCSTKWYYRVLRAGYLLWWRHRLLQGSRYETLSRCLQNVLVCSLTCQLCTTWDQSVC